MLNINIFEIEKAVKRDGLCKNDRAVKLLAERIVKSTDERLEKNIAEWINGETITDIWVGKYCINVIMQIRNDKNFVEALNAMNAYINDSEKGEDEIWRDARWVL